MRRATLKQLPRWRASVEYRLREYENKAIADQIEHEIYHAPRGRPSKVYIPEQPTQDTGDANNRWVSTEELAKFFSVSERTIGRQIKSGKLQTLQIGTCVRVNIAQAIAAFTTRPITDEPTKH